MGHPGAVHGDRGRSRGARSRAAKRSAAEKRRMRPIAASAVVFASVVVTASAYGQSSEASLAAPILADNKYRFCHDPSYTLTRREQRWCPLLDDHAKTSCQALVRGCANPARADRAGG